MKKIYTITLLALALFAAGCDDVPTADSKQAAATEQMMSEANRQIGMPNITRFSQKKMMKLIQEECDREDLICYAYMKSDYTGRLIFIGKCIGYGVPYAAQFTNPERLSVHDSYGVLAMPQPDPNGLFMPSSASATWLMMIDPQTGKPRVAYFEPEIVVSPFPLGGSE